MEAIIVEHLTKKFGDFTAVDDLTFSVNKGEVFGLLGPNGAGKTTTVRMLSCLISSTNGSATISGYNITNKDDAMRIRKITGIVHDDVGLYENLTAYENLLFFGRMYEAPDKTIKTNIERYLNMLDLWDWKDKQVSSFSKGMRQKVAIARALVHDPTILFMDEPTANLDPEASKVIRETILSLKSEDRTIFLNTHNLDEAQRICDRIGVLKTRMIAVDTPVSLEKSMTGRRTNIILDAVSEGILDAVRALKPLSLEVQGRTLVLELSDPAKETPAIITSIAAAGGKITTVNETGASLEDVYLKLVKE